MDTQQDSSSSQSSGSQYQSPGPSSAALISSTLISLCAMTGITIAWLMDKIPDWRYAVGGLLVAAYPTDAIGLLKGAIASRLSSRK